MLSFEKSQRISSEIGSRERGGKIFDWKDRYSGVLQWIQEQGGEKAGPVMATLKCIWHRESQCPGRNRNLKGRNLKIGLSYQRQLSVRVEIARNTQ